MGQGTHLDPEKKLLRCVAKLLEQYTAKPNIVNCN